MRHPDGLFDELVHSAKDGMTAQELASCDAWQAGQGYLTAGYFWEAREVWRPVRDVTQPKTVERLVAEAAVLLADAGLTLRKGDAEAARQGCDQVEAYLYGLNQAILDVPMTWFSAQCDAVRAMTDDAPAP